MQSENDIYDYDEIDGPQVPDKLDKDGDNPPAFLNITANYTSSWGLDEGVRELFQNWRDGLLEIPNRKLLLSDISIECVDHQPESGNHFEFTAFDGTRNVLGRISFMTSSLSTGAERTKIELFNRFITLDREHLYLGDSTKKFKGEFAGGHGEGMKVGVNALLRAGYSVDFLTNYHLWHWNHFRGRELRVNFFKPKGHQDIARAADASLYIDVRGPAMDVKILDKFLFLRVPPVNERIRPADAADVARLGTILISKKYSNKLFVAGIYVQDDKRLYYGYDIPNLRLTRDREVPSTFDLAYAMSNLWGNLLPVSSQARGRFLELFETSPGSLDVSYAKYCIAETPARALFQELKERYPDSWFCCLSGGVISSTDLVIIQSCLKLQPKGLHEDLWYIIHDRYSFVKTADEERRRRFKAAPPTKVIASPSLFAAHTLHLLRIFLALDDETQTVSVSFVDGNEFQGLEYVAETSNGRTQFLVNDSNLDAMEVDHPACVRYYNIPYSERKIAVPKNFTCNCSAIKLANLVCDEVLRSRSSSDRNRLNTVRQNLVHWIPVDVSFEPYWGEADDITSVRISWSSLWPRNDIKFIIVIYDVSTESTNETKVILTEANGITDSKTKTIDYRAVSVGGPADPSPVHEVDRMRTSSHYTYFGSFKPGREYCAQIQMDRTVPLTKVPWEAPPTQPFYFYGPLKPPRDLAVRWRDLDELSVTWSASEAATSYELIFVGKGGGKEVREVQAEDGLSKLEWIGLPNLGAPEMIQVRALGANGLASERFAEMPVPNQLLPPTGISVSWRSASELIAKWDKTLGAGKYEIRLHRSGEETESFEVSTVEWKGSPRQPLPFAISIRSLGSNERQSVVSPQVPIPKHPVPVPAPENKDPDDAKTVRVPKKDNSQPNHAETEKGGDEDELGPDTAESEAGPGTIQAPKKDEDATIRAPKNPVNEPFERTEDEKVRQLPVRAPLEPTGGKNLDPISTLTSLNIINPWSDMVERGALATVRRKKGGYDGDAANPLDPGLSEYTKLGVFFISLFQSSKYDHWVRLDEPMSPLEYTLSKLPVGHPSLEHAKSALNDAWRPVDTVTVTDGRLDNAILIYEQYLTNAPGGWDTEILKSCLAHCLIQRGTPADLCRAATLILSLKDREDIPLGVVKNVGRETIPNLPVPDLTTEIRRLTENPSASGGFADVYLADWVQSSFATPAKVAVKVVRVVQADWEDPTARKKIEKSLKSEVDIWHKLSHPNVVELIGITRGWGHCVSMVCPWYANGSLNSFLQRYRSLVYKERLRLIREIASGLYYLHFNSIIHGDLSGSNILINDEQHALLYDFGTSKFVRNLGLTSTMTSIAYSPRWAAPEVFESDAAVSITLFGDVYSFGSVAFQVFSGTYPYHYIDTEAKVFLHRLREKKPPKRSSNIKDAHWELLLKCWDREPHARPSSESLTKWFGDDEVYMNGKAR